MKNGAFLDISFYIDDRNESEVIICPKSKGGKLSNLKCELLNPEEYYKGKMVVTNETGLRMANEHGIAVEDYMEMHPEYFK